MIDRASVLPLTRQALLLLSRSSVYFLPRPVPPDYLDTLSAVHRLCEVLRRKKAKDARL